MNAPEDKRLGARVCFVEWQSTAYHVPARWPERPLSDTRLYKYPLGPVRSPSITLSHTTTSFALALVELASPASLPHQQWHPNPLPLPARLLPLPPRRRLRRPPRVAPRLRRRLQSLPLLVMTPRRRGERAVRRLTPLTSTRVSIYLPNFDFRVSNLKLIKCNLYSPQAGPP